jgi:hypothetical protein
MKNPSIFTLRSCRTLFVMAALAAGSTLSAATILEDTFEEYTAGTAPTSPWSTTSNITVSSNADAQSAFGPEGDTKGLRNRNLNASFTPAATATFDLSSVTYSSLDIQFDYMYVTQTGNPQFILQDDGTNAIRMMLTTVNGYVSVREGSTFNEITTMSINSGTWYRFYLSINLESSTFDLTIEDENGTSVSATSLAFENSVTDVNTLVYNYNVGIASTGGEYYIDNVLVQTIPEPATLSLGFGGLAMLAAWLRKRVRS